MSGNGPPLRIAILAETYLPYLSGVTVSTEALARGLGAAGHDVLLVAPRPGGDAAPGTAGAVGPEPAYAWLPSMALPIAPPGYRVPVPIPGGAWRAARAFRPDVVHAQSPFTSGLAARRLARRRGGPLVFTHHTRFGDYAHYLGPLARPGGAAAGSWLRAFWAGCDAVVAPGTDLGREIQARLPASARTVVRVIPTGVDADGIRTLTARDPRVEAGWRTGVPVAIALGRLAPEKCVDDVLEAVAGVAGLHLAIVGDGPSTDGLRRRAAEPDLAERTWFAGRRPRPEALALLAGSDLFVVASRTETQGLVVAEALASGVPVVALDAPGVRDAVSDGIDGLLVPADPLAGRAGRMAAALRGLVADPDRRRALAAAAEAGAERLAQPARIAEVVALYRELIARRSSAPPSA